MTVHLSPFVFPCNPFNGLKGTNYYLHFPVAQPKFKEVKRLAKVPASCKQLRQDLSPGVPRAKAQLFASPFWGFLVRTQLIREDQLIFS